MLHQVNWSIVSKHWHNLLLCINKENSSIKIMPYSHIKRGLNHVAWPRSFPEVWYMLLNPDRFLIPLVLISCNEASWSLNPTFSGRTVQTVKLSDCSNKFSHMIRRNMRLLDNKAAKHWTGSFIFLAKWKGSPQGINIAALSSTGSWLLHCLIYYQAPSISTVLNNSDTQTKG